MLVEGREVGGRNEGEREVGIRDGREGETRQRRRRRKQKMR